MTLDDLRVFAAVCRVRNLSAVAREMNCSQSAVSQHVRRLEKEVGLPLVERRPRGVVPTSAGEILYRSAAEGLTALSDGLRQIEELRTGRSGTVAVAAGSASIRHFMGGAVQAFRKRYPQVELEFRPETTSEQCLRALRAGAVDLAWIMFTAPAPGLELRPVTELDWVLAVRADDPLARLGSLRPADLVRDRLIHPPCGPDDGSGQLDPPERQAAIDWETALLLTELGLGHALVPAVAGLHERSDGLVLLPLEGVAPLTVGWAARQWSALPPPSRDFAEQVAKLAGESKLATGGPPAQPAEWGR
ncbi:LysR family transcriptional regulator [Streptomyces sp. NA04227]|uniref:LysR family transcriptional regulator n=1 Tax=Streptomyces sp. NA04227 TaxID=2742136 RepID=UPI00158FC563|nr:LysR family transcriptional regulator [Streptomyces sp. NA04227]QKW06579.1 LysR family transcriptional regulator [Streptomyces sp. NA04227]